MSNIYGTPTRELMTPVPGRKHKRCKVNAWRTQGPKGEVHIFKVTAPGRAPQQVAKERAMWGYSW